MWKPSAGQARKTNLCLTIPKILEAVSTLQGGTLQRKAGKREGSVIRGYQIEC